VVNFGQFKIHVFQSAWKFGQIMKFLCTENFVLNKNSSAQLVWLWFLGWLRENSWMQIADSKFNRLKLAKSCFEFQVHVQVLKFWFCYVSMYGRFIGKHWVTTHDRKGWSTAGLKFQINQL